MTTLTRRTLLAAAAATPAAALLPACGGSDDNDDTPRAPDRVTYKTSFGLLGRDAYAHVAQHLGFFADANIRVTIEPGGGTAANSQDLLSGNAHFAVFDIAGAAIARLAEDITGFTVIAAIHQLPPVALMSVHPDITATQDLAGRTVGIAPGTVTERLFPAYLQLAGVDPREVTVEPIAPTELLPALVAGNVDVIEQFTMGEPLVAGVTGQDVTVLPYSQYLTDLYGVGLMTTDQLAEQDPDLCVRFRDALLRGLDHALNHPQQAAEILAESVPEIDVDTAAQELEIMRAYSDPGDGPLGGITETKIGQMLALLQSGGLLPADTAAMPEDLVRFDLTPQQA